MNGLDLELYLRLLQIDRSTFVLAGVALTVLGVGVWAGFGSRKLLRKCLILSVISHVLLVRYGQPTEWARAGFGNGKGSGTADRSQQPQPLPPGIRSLQIVDVQTSDPAGNGSTGGGSGKGTGGGSGSLPSELPEALPGIDSAPQLATRAQPAAIPAEMPERVDREAIALPAAEVREALPVASARPVRPVERPPAPVEGADSNAPAAKAPVELVDQERQIATVAPTGTNAPARTASTPLPVPDSAPRIVRESPARTAATATIGEMTRPAPRASVPLPDVRIDAPPASAAIRRELPKRTDLTQSSPGTAPGTASDNDGLTPAEELAPPVPFLSRAGEKAGDANGEGAAKPAATMIASAAGSSSTALPDTSLRDRIRNRSAGGEPKAAMPDRPANREALALPRPDLKDAPPVSLADSRSARLGNRPLEQVPAPYRSRLDPDRAKLALQAGASGQSEKAVEMALDWLRKHQDADGRWDGGAAKYRDGTIAPDEDSFTVHCPPGEICFGECFYWEADTALTGLSLLAYLGAGYTHTQGKYADTVARGLDFLIRSQKADGDLRGRSVAVGMYCHSMATLALCEAYALTGDERLKQPAARAVAFLVAAQAEGGAAWRYEPRAPVGDTSILGWAVLALKSGRACGFSVPEDCIGGIQAWLDGVSSGKSGGLAKYQPWKEVTPTMTAEAWVCRWFLKLDPNATRNREAANHLFEHGPDRDPYNLYYWYYGTLGMFQQGGEDWNRWNALVRDRIVKRQKTTGHMAGSWDPDDSQWGNYGGRIYCTALATMTLEVYYRFLRTYEESETATATQR